VNGRKSPVCFRNSIYLLQQNTRKPKNKILIFHRLTSILFKHKRKFLNLYQLGRRVSSDLCSFGEVCVRSVGRRFGRQVKSMIFCVGYFPRHPWKLLSMTYTSALMFSLSLQRKFQDVVLGTRILNFPFLALIFSRITYGSRS